MARKEDFRFISTNAEGIRTDCAFYQVSINECRALRDYYNSKYGERCTKCPFFKTKDQYDIDRKKYGEWKEVKEDE